MNCRRHGRKPTIALWMLIAVADLALVVAAAGLLITLLVVAGAAVVAGGVIAARNLGRREAEPAEAVVRRRA
ncbi:hypothetical protein AB0M02_02025 [Actinoplanes sp. NPDC051861]|uniref:hypothetical protein n=1 Tax=Actinoplanes sp. NPDC051861 TaxID=3155170 RepID=UPI00343FF694